MQGKGIVKFFLVVLVLVSLLQYFYMLPTGKVEKNADEYAKNVASTYPESERYDVEKAQRIAYLDSMSTEEILKIPGFSPFTYESLKSKQLAYGLDLAGGLSTVLQVDLRDFIRQLSKSSKDPTFNDALDKATEAQKTAQKDYITLFGEEYAKIQSPEKKSLAYIFRKNSSLSDKIEVSATDDDVLDFLRTESNEVVKLTYDRLKQRIDKLGVIQPNVSLDAARDLIVVELPGVENPERARKFLVSSAKLEFWDVYRLNDPGVLDAFVKADERLKKGLDSGEEELNENFQIDTTYAIDSDGNETDSITSIDTLPTSLDPFSNGGPLFKILDVNRQIGETIQYPLSVMGAAEKNKRDDVLSMLNSPEVKGLFPREMGFRFDAKPMVDADGKDTKMYFLYAIRKERGRENAPIEGDVITGASSGADPTTSEIQVSMSMDRKGAKKWAEMTTKAAQDGNRPIAVVLDDEVVSAPNVNGAITQGRSQITGNFSIQEGEDLANILEIGKLPAKTQIIQEALVGPYLGKKNIKDSMWSLIIGLALVLIFMVVYYATGGIVAIIALLANLFFIFGALASFGTVLTLPGFAGVILTIGMAVDANVIIFERIREELREGKSIKMAVRDGFTHSYSAIIDANVTTLLTAIVLVYFGLGPIKGFAVVLIIGILSSLFTAVLLGRMMIEWWIDKDKPMSFWTGLSKNAFANLKIDWVSKRKMAYVFSGILIVASFASFFTRGWELGVDFKGGYSYNIQLVEEDKLDVDQLRATLTDVFEGQEPVVKQVDGPSEYQTLNVTTSYNIDDISEGAAEIVMAKLYQGVKTASNSSVADSVFRDPGGKGLDQSHIVSSSKVGATIADDISKGSRYATIFALLLIFLYIFLRFSKWQYSAGAIGALIHDTIIVLGVFSLCYGWIGFSLEINQAFIAALLTVIGYSINDTVVVFDRIREYFGLYTGKSKEEVINAAINSTVSRTIITSLTTLFVVAILFFFGGSSIKGFAFALLIGIIVGTYSSIFVATPILTDLTGDLKTKEAGKSTKSSFSKAATSK